MPAPAAAIRRAWTNKWADINRRHKQALVVSNWTARLEPFGSNSRIVGKPKVTRNGLLERWFREDGRPTGSYPETGLWELPNRGPGSMVGRLGNWAEKITFRHTKSPNEIRNS